MCVDSATKYLHRARIYLGKNVETEGNLGENIIRELLGDLLGKGRKVCCDNFFTSPSLGQFLYQAKTFLIGTIRANRKGLPKGYGNQALEKGQCQFLYRNEETLVKVQAKKIKRFMVYCNYRHDADYNEKEKKPTLVTNYNKRKPHVDLFNREAEKYAYRPATRRWPMRVFHWIIDCAAINAHVLHQQHTGASSRRMFLNELADKLMEQQQQIHVNEHWSNIRFRKIAESFDELRTKTMGGSHSKLIHCKSINDDGEICNKPSRQTQECNNCHKPACPEHYVELKLCHGCEQNMKIEEPAMCKKKYHPF
uniref:PiggyBac transposable element-derived protein domain-containing protein n=1 Tax=Acrobeloides nanus TaxID=290746 RepID=A0A914CJA2_9BILA